MMLENGIEPAEVLVLIWYIGSMEEFSSGSVAVPAAALAFHVSFPLVRDFHISFNCTAGVPHSCRMCLGFHICGWEKMEGQPTRLAFTFFILCAPLLAPPF